MVFQTSDPLFASPVLAATLGLLGVVLLSERPRATLLATMGVVLTLVVWIAVWYLLSVFTGPHVITWLETSALPQAWLSVATNALPCFISWFVALPLGVLAARTLGASKKHGLFSVALFAGAGLLLPLINHDGFTTFPSRFLLLLSCALVLTLALAMNKFTKDPI